MEYLIILAGVAAIFFVLFLVATRTLFIKEIVAHCFMMGLEEMEE